MMEHKGEAPAPRLQFAWNGCTLKALGGTLEGPKTIAHAESCSSAGWPLEETTGGEFRVHRASIRLL